MFRSIAWTSFVGFAAACTSTPDAKPHDMSAVEHERQGQRHEAMADGHGAQVDPAASVERTRCSARGARAGEDVGCWTSVRNPTAEHARMAGEHRRQAADHRAASATLRDAEARVCVGIDPDDRDQSPFEHLEDIDSVTPLKEQSGTTKSPSQRSAGATVTFRAVPGLTGEWLQRVVDCHLARNGALGHAVPEMPNCPLVPRGAEARVTSNGSGFAVAIRSSDDSSARDILARAERLGALAGPPSRSP